MHMLLGLVVIVELTGRLTGQIALEYPVKPLIMIWMALYFMIRNKKREFMVPVLIAFFFSWVGDNLLMFSDRNELFFFAGVGGFFLAQITYIYTFARYSELGGRGWLQKRPVFALFFIAYLTGIYLLLYPGLEGIMKPIILIYALSLIGMSMMALNRNGRVNHRSFILVFLGSLLFVLSDSMIAIDRFYAGFPMAGFWIMATYIPAQYLIMRGLAMER